MPTDVPRSDPWIRLHVSRQRRTHLAQTTGFSEHHLSDGIPSQWYVLANTIKCTFVKQYRYAKSCAALSTNTRWRTLRMAPHVSEACEIPHLRLPSVAHHRCLQVPFVVLPSTLTHMQDRRPPIQPPSVAEVPRSEDPSTTHGEQNLGLRQLHLHFSHHRRRNHAVR